MKKTQITKMPDLSALTILPKQRELFIRDTTIFSALAYRKRQVETVDDAAAPNDYVLCEISGQSGNVQTVHVELGGGHFPALEQILAGTRAGQSVEGTIGGDPSTIRVLSVNRPREYPLSDESIAALEIPGVHTLADYRRRYIVQHGRALAERVFSALQKRLLEEVTALMEVDFSTEEMDHYHRLQREMIQGITGDADQRILDAYGYADGKTPEECERMFYEENKRTFLIYVWGRTLAADRQVPVSEEAYRQALEYFCLLHDKTEQQVEEEGLQDDVLTSFYLQYGIGEVRNYYYSIVRFSAEDVAPMALE